MYLPKPPGTMSIYLAVAITSLPAAVSIGMFIFSILVICAVLAN